MFSCFVGTAFSIGEFGFGRDELSFAGSLQHCLAVDGQLGFCGFEGLDPFVQFGEEFLDLGYDPFLFGGRGNGHFQHLETSKRDVKTAITYSGLHLIDPLFGIV